MSSCKFPHPDLPFILVEGHDLEDGQAGWCQWRYSIENLSTFGGYRSELDAREAAENELFSRHGEYVEHKLSAALDCADFELALAIAHHRGL